MLQSLNLLPSTFSTFHYPSLLSMTNYNQGKQLNSHHAYARAEMFEEKEETEGAAKNQLAERKRGVSQKKQRRK